MLDETEEFFYFAYHHERKNTFHHQIALFCTINDTFLHNWLLFVSQSNVDFFFNALSVNGISTIFPAMADYTTL